MVDADGNIGDMEPLRFLGNAFADGWEVCMGGCAHSGLRECRYSAHCILRNKNNPQLLWSVGYF
jgi:hypothetical protein